MKFYFLLFLSLPSFGFTLYHQSFPRFPVNEVMVNIADEDCTNAGENAQSLKDLTEQAIDKYWNTVPTSALRLKIGDIRTYNIDNTTELNTAVELTDANSILISCSDTAAVFPSSLYLARGKIKVTVPNRGVVLVNNTAGSSFAALDREKKIAVLAHEIGHAIGLGHTNDRAALMYYSPSGKVQMYLTRDDYDGVSYLYPNRPPVSCGNITDINDSNSSGMFFLTLMMSLFSLVILRKLYSNFSDHFSK